MFTVPYPNNCNISDLDWRDWRDHENGTFEDTENNFEKEIIRSETEEWIIESESESQESNYGEENDDNNDIADILYNFL